MQLLSQRTAASARRVQARLYVVGKLGTDLRFDMIVIDIADELLSVLANERLGHVTKRAE
ncbi:hypothetical protein D3C73_1641100 [compost metagenome]